MAVEAILCPVVADVNDDLTGYLGDIYLSRCGYLAHTEHHTRCDAGLAGNSSELVLFKYSVENGVRNLIADLVGMSLSY